jgi:hypothetical protein
MHGLPLHALFAQPSGHAIALDAYAQFPSSHVPVVS